MAYRLKRLSSKQEIGSSSPSKTSHFNATLSSDQQGKRIQKQTEGTAEQKGHLKTTVIKVLWLCQVTNEEKEYKIIRKDHQRKRIT